MKTITFDESKWKLVPVEPTGVMKDAGAFSGLPAELSQQTWTAAQIYRAMLAAAPVPPVAAPADPVLARGSRFMVDMDSILRHAESFDNGQISTKAVREMVLRHQAIAAPADQGVCANCICADGENCPKDAPADPNAPAILEAISWHARERDDLKLEEAVKAFRFGWKEVRGRDDRAMLLQLIDLMASAPAAAADQVRDSLEQQITERRIAIIPEYEGGFHVHLYGDEDEPQQKGFGKTPSDAIRALRASPVAENQPTTALTISGNLCEIGQLEDEGGEHGIVIKREFNNVTVKGLTMDQVRPFAPFFLDDVTIEIRALRTSAATGDKEGA